jgi:hypothetical protein
MENYFEIFPHYGRNVSTLWKIEPKSSTLWKNFQWIFHTMERMFPRCGKPGFRAVLRGFQAVLRGC